MKNETAHSPIGASSMYRWGNCPGSVRMSKGLEKTESEYAREGTKAHEVAAEILKTGSVSHTQHVPQEMLEAIQVYIDAVRCDQLQLDPTYNGNLFLVEHGFDLSEIHPQAWGTADCVIYNVKTKILTVYDYKHGSGIFVDVEDNEQLMYYALGALLSTGVPCKEVVLKIVQPRFNADQGPIREWRFNPVILLDFAADLADKAEATDDPKASLNPGEWCRFCPAIGICPSVQNKALAVAKAIFSPTLPYDPKSLSETLEKLPMLEAFVSQVREFAYGEAMKGRVPPGYKLVQKRGTRKWIEGVGKFLSKTLDGEKLKQCYTEPSMKTPAQIEKIVPKEKHSELQKFQISESSGLKLAHISEPGEPIMLDAKSVFEQASIFE